MTLHSADSQDHRDVEHSRLTRSQRQAALGLGILAGGGGAYAVFASSNQAGTVVLLLIALVFLLIGVEGTPLLRRPGPRLPALRRRAASAWDTQRDTGLDADIALSDGELGRQRARSSTTPRDVGSYD